MSQRRKISSGRSVLRALLLCLALAAAGATAEPREGALSERVARTLNAAIEALHAERFDDAAAAADTLDRDALSPYERARLELVLFNIAFGRERYDAARAHLTNALETGGLNAQEVSQVRYQRAQLFMTEGRWQDGAAALEQWFATQAEPSAAAYYLLAVAYYQTGNFEAAEGPAREAVARMTTPQETWLGLLLALRLQRGDYGDAIVMLQRLVTAFPAKRSYWVQLSAAYGQLEDYASALATFQLAYDAGLLTEESDLLRLVDLLLLNDLPLRAAQLLEAAIADGRVPGDARAYEKLANAWLAARELDKARAPLAHAADLAGTSKLLVRLGQLEIERSDWPAAEAALTRALAARAPPAEAPFLLGVALYEQERLEEARHWFVEAQASKAHAETADTYLRLIEARLGETRID